MARMDEISESQRMDRLDEKGVWQYPSTAGTGHDEIELPTLPGSPNAVERMHVKDFGAHVAAKIEATLNRQGYMRSGPQQGAVEVFAHYAGAARGIGLMDRGALGRMETLAREFAAEPYRQEYFEQVVRPYLLTLNPERR